MYFTCLASVLLYYGCDRFYGLHVTNNSDESIAVFVARPEFTEGVYPDTSLLENVSLRTIVPGTNGIWDSYYPWEKPYLEILPADTLSIYIISDHVYKTVPWDSIRKEYMILRRYDLSEKDLRLLDDFIPYPPSEAMRNMKMYPPYGDDDPVNPDVR